MITESKKNFYFWGGGLRAVCSVSSKFPKMPSFRSERDKMAGVNISPYFLDAHQGKGFGFQRILGKVLRCKLGRSRF